MPIDHARIDAVLTWLVARLSERSTYLGLGLLLSAAGLSVAPDLGQAVVAVGVAVAGLVSVLLKDKII